MICGHTRENSHSPCPLWAKSGHQWRAATAGERDVSLSVRVLQRWRHSTGSDCKNLHCPTKYCLCGSSLRTSDTGSPNTHSLYLSRSPRTTGPRKPKLAVNRQTPQQERRRYLESSVSSSASMLDAVNNTERPVSIRPAIRSRSAPCPFYLRKRTCAAHWLMSALGQKRTCDTHRVWRRRANSRFY